MAARSDGYGEDLAYVHHVGYGDFARLAGEALPPVLRRFGIGSGLVVDLGSGSGIWARALVDANYSVLGVEASAAMVVLARRQVPEARFVEASFLDVQLPSCDAVTSIGEVFSYAFDRRNGRAALATLFRRVHDALRPGGVFVFDVGRPGRLSRSAPERKWTEGPDWAIHMETRQDRARRREKRRIVVFRRVGDFYRRDEEIHRSISSTATIS